jgi:hypothetical protein
MRWTLRATVRALFGSGLALAALPLPASAIPASTATIELRFINDPAFPLQRYSVEAVGSLPWWAVTFVITPTHSFTFDAASFDAIGSLASSNGGARYDFVRFEDGHPASVAVPIGTLMLTSPGGLGPPGTHMGRLATAIDYPSTYRFIPTGGFEGPGRLKGYWVKPPAPPISSIFGVTDNINLYPNAFVCLDGAVGCWQPAGAETIVRIENAAGGPAAIPEPATLALLSASLLGLVLLRRAQ